MAMAAPSLLRAVARFRPLEGRAITVFRTDLMQLQNLERNVLCAFPFLAITIF
jgi:hypothetical protein